MIQFQLTELEEKLAKEFMQKHKNCCYERLHKPFFSTIGGQFQFIITPAGLGNCVSIKCNACDDIKEITDINNW